MEHIDKGEMFKIVGPHNHNRIDLNHQEATQSIGVAIALIVVICGWAMNKIFRRDLLW